jgi:ribokinase
MQLFNVGSINWDHCYQLMHFVRPGETISSNHYQKLLGGKGANQSAAAARAGASVHHVGAVGSDEFQAQVLLKELGVNVGAIEALPGYETGHAIIQINQDGENAIVLFAGANRGLTEEQIDRQLSMASKGDWVLLQNETNLIDYVVEQAKSKGLNIAFNPAPMDKALTLGLLPKLDLLIVNEIELRDLTATENTEKAETMALDWSEKLEMLVTQGSAGVSHYHKRDKTFCEAFKVDAVDTTAAGDTFIGYFMAAKLSSLPIKEALKMACGASALSVTKAGAIPSIPARSDVEQFIQEQEK